MKNIISTYRKRFISAAVAFLLIFGVQIPALYGTVNSAAAHDLPTRVQESTMHLADTVSGSVLGGLKREQTLSAFLTQRPGFPHSPNHILFFGEEEITDTQEEQSKKTASILPQ